MTLPDIPIRGRAANPKSAGKLARGFDLYETPPEATRALLKAEWLPRRIWEPAAGRGAIMDTLCAARKAVSGYDLVDYGHPRIISGRDFLFERAAPPGYDECIVTNPPYLLAGEFIEHALTLVPHVIVLLRLAFLEGGDEAGSRESSRRRARLLDGGMLARVLIFRNRLPMMHRDGYAGPKTTSATAYAWFVFNRNHTGPTILKRIAWEKT